MSENTQAIFVSGLYLNRVHEKAPAYVITNQDIHVEKLIAWLQANKHLANEKGYIRIQGKESQKQDERGNNVRYFQVDTYKKETQEQPKAVDPGAYPEPLTDESIPF